MIIDSHQHIGDAMSGPLAIEEAELVGAMDRSGVDAALLLPLPGVSNEPAAHDHVASVMKKYPGRFYGVATLNPHTADRYGVFRTEKQYFEEVERCVKKLKFVGLKLHPPVHNCPPTEKDALKVFQAAREFNIPLIIHTGLGVPMALPSLIIPRAKEFPEVKIVMAHSGAHIFTPEAFIVAGECPNVYLETSWCVTHRVKQMVEQFGAGRVMFGSDLPSNIATSLALYRAAGLSKEQLEQCLSGTVREVFKLP